ncbi:DUF7576 family protein [Halorussus halophilus]|uniref:DUF7576 family protein n=1 Tax=Halorussus halophilus TaxID=2650975 RepID=UPI001300F5A1|nr:hypothetical protein [Halorussus halophilus]
MTDRESDETIADASRRESKESESVEKVCADCGTLLDSTEWLPTRTSFDDENVVVYLFCDEDCRDAWQSE